MLRLLLFILCILFLGGIVGKANAQIKPAQSQYLEERGFLVNPGFEQGYKGWTISGGCTKSLVSDVPLLNKSLKITCVNATFSVKQETTGATQLQGQQGVFDIQVKATVDGPRVSSLSAGLRGTEYIVQQSSSYRRLNDIPVVLSSVSNGLEIYSDVNWTGEIVIDNVKVGLAPAGFLNTDYDDVPIGTVLSYGSETLPDGYLLADGACIKKGDYASLYSVIGGSDCTVDTTNDGFNLPNLQNAFLRGLTGGRSVFDTQTDETAVNSLTASTTSGGEHKHDFLFSRVSTVPVGTPPYQYLGSSGSNVLEVRTSFDRTVVNSVGTNQSSHSHTINLSGGGETRPENKAVVYIIKAKGRSPITQVSQKSMSPDKAGFIIWGAMDIEIEGYKKADGSCISRADFPDYFRNVGTLYGSCNYAGQGADTGVLLPDLVTGNRFPRMAGGSLSVGQTQNDATAVNGLGTATTGAHRHNEGTRVQNELGDSLYGGFGTGTARGEIYDTSSANFVTFTSTNGDHSHTVTSSDTETRPNSIALIAYVRVVDRDQIIGSFEQIKSDNLHYITYNGTGIQSVSTGTEEKVSLQLAGPVEGFTTSSNEAVATRDGFFKIGGSIGYDNTGGTQNRVTCIIRKNGGIVSLGRMAGTNTGVSSVICPEKTIQLQAGDTIGMYFGNDTGSGQTLRTGGTDTWLNITEIPDTQAIIKNLNDNRNVECQLKYLTSDIGNTTDILDLRFNNLTIGKTYTAKAQVRAQGTTTPDEIVFNMLNNGGLLAYCNMFYNGGTQTKYCETKHFKATGTTMVSTISNLATGNQLIGNSTMAETWVELCELPDNYITTTKFN